MEHSVICVQYIQKFVSGCVVVVTHYWQLKPGALSSISYNYHTFHFSEFHLVKPKLFLAEARCARAFWFQIEPSFICHVVGVWGRDWWVCCQFYHVMDTYSLVLWLYTDNMPTKIVMMQVLCKLCLHNICMVPCTKMHGAQCLCSTQVLITLNTQSHYWTLIDGLLCYSLANKAKNARVASTELDEKSEDTQSSSTASRWLQDSYYFWLW